MTLRRAVRSFLRAAVMSFSAKGEEWFRTYAMKIGTVKSLDKDGPVYRWLQGLRLDSQQLKHRLKDLPPNDGREVRWPEIAKALAKEGYTTKGIGALCDLADWYHNNKPSEHETIAHLVVPLLKVLGWQVKRIAVEWNRIDVALFGETPRKDVNLRLAIEAKKMGEACFPAKRQCVGYLDNRPGCPRLVVTDGVKYGVYDRSSRDFKLAAYLSLLRPRRSYPIFDCGGAVDALIAMMPPSLRQQN